MDSQMKIIIWTCLLCLGSSNVCGMFFDSDSADENDFIGEALNSINQYFDIQAAAESPKPSSQREGNQSPETTAATTTSTSSGFLDEVETSLEHATNTLDDLWQQFRKGLTGLISSFNDEGNKDTDQQIVTTTTSLQHLEVATTAQLVKVISTTLGPIPKTTTATIVSTPATLASATATTATP